MDTWEIGTISLVTVFPVFQFLLSLIIWDGIASVSYSWLTQFSVAERKHLGTFLNNFTCFYT